MQHLTTRTLTGAAGAQLSDCEQYRYRLWRDWGIGLPMLSFIMLNPSTADHLEDDATIVRCTTRAIACGFGRLEVVNLFPLRSRDPSALLTHRAPLGPEPGLNDKIIKAVIRESEMVICAWGTHKAAPTRAAEVLRIAQESGFAHRLHHLGLNKDGSPKHPLYIAGAKRPEPYRPWETV